MEKWRRRSVAERRSTNCDLQTVVRMSIHINGKWVTVSPVDTPIAEAAAHVLTARLHAVQDFLPLAAREAEKDIEHVHRLRVSCRRADAAVKAFQPLLGETVKPTRRWLKRIRRSAGPARDADVLTLRLQEECDPAAEFSNRFLDFLASRRAAAQPSLVRMHAKARRKQLENDFAGAVAAVQETADSAAGQQSFVATAREALHVAAEDCLSFATADAQSIDLLHQLRIAGKRLRYCLELFHSPLDRRLRNSLYPQIVELQDRLGSINDHAAAQRLLQGWLGDLPADSFAAGLAAQVVREHELTLQSQRQFGAWWTADRQQALQRELASAIAAR